MTPSSTATAGDVLEAPAPPASTAETLEIQFRRAGRRPGSGIIGGLFLLWLLSGIYIVSTDQQVVVTRFGAVVNPRVMPGIHFALPWPIESVTKLKVQQLQRLVIGGEPADTVTGRSQPLQSEFFTGDQNIVSVRVVVQYSVGVPVDYLFQNEDVARSVGAAVETALAQRIAQHTVDDVLTTEKQSIQQSVRAAAQQLIDDYQTGVLLSTVNIESAVPPPEAANAFRDVASARADSARIVSEAQGYANDLVPKARGQGRQMLESAHAYEKRKINEAQGDAGRFMQVAAEYPGALQVNGQRLYIEAMEQVLPAIRKVIVDTNGNVDLTVIRRGDSSSK